MSHLNFMSIMSDLPIPTPVFYTGRALGFKVKSQFVRKVVK